MFSPSIIIAIICLYIGILFFISVLVERKPVDTKKWSDNAIVYSLSLAIYCSAWTYYGSVGMAATSGMLFLTIYLGPTLSIILWWTILRKLVRIKQHYHISSIVDLIAARYNNSHALAAIATILACTAGAPYIGLQFKAVISTFGVITARHPNPAFFSHHFGVTVVTLMIMFTIIFGVRRLDPTERHQGMVVAVATESLVKLVMFLAAGIFITYFLFDGFGDIFKHFEVSRYRNALASGGTDSGGIITWMTYMLLGFSAILFLPRQFHIAVVENTNEKHIRTAMWLFPIYLLLINIFVLPIAMGGLLKGLPLKDADTFVLRLPTHSGSPWISLMVFIGGFSAATSMIMISAMTLATMVTNHLALPIVNQTKRLGFLKRHVLRMKWAAVTLIIVVGYWFNLKLGGMYSLVNMGMIAFAAAFQFAPVILGGIFWRKGNKGGALLGLSAGFAVWLYSLLIPAFAKSGFIGSSFLENGPWNIWFLKPEQLFGVSGLAPLPHAVFLSMVFNVGFYILGSLIFRMSEEEEHIAESFVSILSPRPPGSPNSHGTSRIYLPEKKEKMAAVLTQYFNDRKAEAMIEDCANAIWLKERTYISSVELSELCGRVEKLLAGSIGASVAHKAIRQAKLFEPEEAKELSEVYSKILADLRVSPEELRQKVDYYREREAFIAAHSRELEEKVDELQKLIAERKRAEEMLRVSENRYRTLFESAGDAIFVLKDGRIIDCNERTCRIFKGAREDILGKKPYEMSPDVQPDGISSKEKAKEKIGLALKGESPSFEWKHVRMDGSLFDAEVNLNEFELESGTHILAIVRDISARKRAETELERYKNSLELLVDERTKELKETQERLITSERLAVLGQFAGSVAHEIRNPLAVISNSVFFIRNKVGSDDEKLVEYMDRITRQISHTAEIIDSMQRLTRIEEPNRSHVNLRAVLLAGYETANVPGTIRTVWDVPDPPIYVNVDKEQMRIVFKNIIKNAAQAMPKGGTLMIKAQAAPSAQGDMIKISFSDEGPGIAVENIGKIFHPLFSTKITGMGFGLAIARMIVEKHGGTIEAASGPEKGAVFTVVLPNESQG